MPGVVTDRNLTVPGCRLSEHRPLGVGFLMAQKMPLTTEDADCVMSSLSGGRRCGDSFREAIRGFGWVVLEQVTSVLRQSVCGQPLLGSGHKQLGVSPTAGVA